MDQRDPAMGRFWLLQALRLTGAAIAMCGALIMAGRIDQSPALGIALLVIGMVDFFVIPAVLAKKWRSEK